MYNYTVSQKNEWKMSASRIISASLPSFCQKLSKWWRFDEVQTKTILHSFFLWYVVSLNTSWAGLICRTRQQSQVMINGIILKCSDRNVFKDR